MSCIARRIPHGTGVDPHALSAPPCTTTVLTPGPRQVLSKPKLWSEDSLLVPPACTGVGKKSWSTDQASTAWEEQRNRKTVTAKVVAAIAAQFCRSVRIHTIIVVAAGAYS